MSDLTVTPDYLDNLATIQDQTADKTGSAATVASGIATDLWVTHGVISGKSNVELISAEAARRSVVEAMQKVSVDLATKLRAAGDAYVGTDGQAAANIDEQVLPR
jgi:Excreted virulence factor EspC, type VII ESX diderm